MLLHQPVSGRDFIYFIYSDALIRKGIPPKAESGLELSGLRVNRLARWLNTDLE